MCNSRVIREMLIKKRFLFSLHIDILVKSVRKQVFSYSARGYLTWYSLLSVSIKILSAHGLHPSDSILNRYPRQMLAHVHKEASFIVEKSL